MTDKFSRNLSMLTDFYEITMSNGYFNKNMKDVIGVFDVFFRKVPDDGGFAVMCGLQQIIDYITELNFSKEDIDYLKKRGFNDEFLNYLSNFKFSCDVWAIPEGTPIFPNEPIITVKGPIIQSQLIDTLILLAFNHQTLIATKAAIKAPSGSPGAPRAKDVTLTFGKAPIRPATAAETLTSGADLNLAATPTPMPAPVRVLAKQPIALR